MFPGRRNGREINDGTERVVEGESDGTGKTGAVHDKVRFKRTENKLSAGEADIWRLPEGRRPSAHSWECREEIKSAHKRSNTGKSIVSMPKYAGFGPTFAMEKVNEDERIKVVAGAMKMRVCRRACKSERDL
jgi:hypothetical protein